MQKDGDINQLKIQNVYGFDNDYLFKKYDDAFVANISTWRNNKYPMFGINSYLQAIEEGDHGKYTEE